MIAPAKLDPASAMGQALLYARDLARLYERVRADEARALAHRARLASELAASTGADRALVYAIDRDRWALVAAHGIERAVVSLSREAASDLGSRVSVRAGEPWSSLGLGARVRVLAIGHETPAGIGVVPADVPALEPTLGLFARLASLVLESAPTT